MPRPITPTPISLPIVPPNLRIPVWGLISEESAPPSCLFPDQLLMSVSAMPFTRLRWKMKKMISGGISVSRELAITFEYSSQPQVLPTPRSAGV
jgi:hypothetical protein